MTALELMSHWTTPGSSRFSARCFDVFIECGFGYTHNFTDFLHRVLFLVVQVDGDSAFRSVQGFWAATSAAPGACRGKSSLRAFADKIAFELGQCAEYVKD